MTRFFLSSGGDVWSLDVLDCGLTRSAELWGLLQPYEHIVAGRNAYGKTLVVVSFLFFFRFIIFLVLLKHRSSRRYIEYWLKSNVS